MQLTKRLQIKSEDKIIEFLNGQPVGRITSIDINGYPQVIPMNFVLVKSKHEVDQHICFLPSYYFHPTDASQADTLYISVVIKGNAYIIDDNEEKAFALNMLMKKYQTEGMYEPLNRSTPSVRAVTVIKVVPNDMRGKYKIGQHWTPVYRLKMAQRIIEREGMLNSKLILDIMGIEVDHSGKLQIKREPVM
jgi:nitroimidazol reductase NimA-like FMN-containing flavoprotein (pyridoxamine 5'-phosphate oxidase superfamily)